MGGREWKALDDDEAVSSYEIIKEREANVESEKSSLRSWT